jgi:chromosome segregation ATPase
MPRQSSITPEAVAEAAEKLIAQGRPVTNQAVHGLLGGGSMSTISPLVRAWKEDQKERQALAERYVPEPIEQLAQELAARIWRDAQEEAGVATEALRRELKKLRDHYSEKQADLEENLKLAGKQNEDAESALNDVQSELDMLQAAYEELTLEHARATEKIAGLEQRVSDLQGMLEKVEARAERAEERLVSVAKGK